MSIHFDNHGPYAEIPREANLSLKRLPFVRTMEYNAQKLQPTNVKSLVMPSSCHALEFPFVSTS